MSTLTPITNRFFQALRKEAKSLVNKPEFTLKMAQHAVAQKYGYEHWKQLTDARKRFAELAAPCERYPVFFWDVKDADGFQGDPHWEANEWAVEACYDLLWKKPRISQSYYDRMDTLAGFLYTGSWRSFEQLDDVANSLMFFTPEFVFIYGCFIPFEELRKSSMTVRELEGLETCLVIYDKVEPYLHQLHEGMTAGILDFSGKFDWNTGDTDLFNTTGWTPRQAGDFVQDLDIEQVILIAPSKGVETSVKSRLGEHLVHVVELSF